jgi:hypothetical protein
MCEVKGCMRAKVKNSRGDLVGLVGLVQPVGVRRLSDRPQPSRVGRVLVGLVGLVRSRPEGTVALHPERGTRAAGDIGQLRQWQRGGSGAAAGAAR